MLFTCLEITKNSVKAHIKIANEANEKIMKNVLKEGIKGLVDIANKSRVKMSNKDYLKHIKKKTKAGNSMSRQAHMELILAND